MSGSKVAGGEKGARLRQVAQPVGEVSRRRIDVTGEAAAHQHSGESCQALIAPNGLELGANGGEVLIMAVKKIVRCGFTFCDMVADKPGDVAFSGKMFRHSEVFNGDSGDGCVKNELAFPISLYICDDAVVTAELWGSDCATYIAAYVKAEIPSRTMSFLDIAHDAFKFQAFAVVTCWDDDEYLFGLCPHGEDYNTKRMSLLNFVVFIVYVLVSCRS